MAPSACKPLAALLQVSLLLIAIILILFTIVPFLLLPLCVYRLIVICAAKCLRPDLSRIVRGVDAITLPTQPPHTTTHQNILIAARVKGRLNFERVKEVINAKFVHDIDDKSGGKLANPGLQEFYVKWWGYIFWKPEEPFSIDNHVQHRVLQPGEEADRVQIEYLAEDYEEGTSPWHVLVLEEPEDDHYQLLFKWNHGFADGYSAVRAWMRIMDEPAVFLEPPPPRIGCLDILTYPFRFLYALARMVTREGAKPLPWPRVPPATLAGAGDWRHHTANYANQVVSLEFIKGIARRQNVTVNAVVQAALSGALRAFLLRYGESQLPPWVRYPVPIPAHSHPPGLCNAIRAVLYTLPVGEEEAKERLRKCHEMLKPCHNSMEGHIMFYATQIFAVIPKCWPFSLLEKAPISIQIYTTNLPGPRKPVQLEGAPVEWMNIQMDAPGSATYFLFFSYCDQLAHVWMGDTRVFTLQDMEDLADFFSKEFQQLDDLDVAVE